MNITKGSVTVFLKYNEKYLFLKRATNKVDHPNVLTGVGGKLEKGENYLECCIREVKEETDLDISNERIVFKGIENWFMESDTSNKKNYIINFFRVDLKENKLEWTSNDEGELVWLTLEEAREEKYILLDDLNYCLEDIEEPDDRIFFFSATVNEELKIVNNTKSYLNI